MSMRSAQRCQFFLITVTAAGWPTLRRHHSAFLITQASSEERKQEAAHSGWGGADKELYE